MTTHEELQDMMDFDSVIRVGVDGTISRADNVDCYASLNVDMDGEDEFYLPKGWELMTGYTGQYGYNGPVLHPSEFIGGGLARDILGTPGYYVSLVVEGSCVYGDTLDCDGSGGCDCPPAGWAVARMELEGN